MSERTMIGRGRRPDPTPQPPAAPDPAPASHKLNAYSGADAPPLTLAENSVEPLVEQQRGVLAEAWTDGYREGWNRGHQAGYEDGAEEAAPDADALVLMPAAAARVREAVGALHRQHDERYPVQQCQDARCVEVMEALGLGTR